MVTTKNGRYAYTTNTGSNDVSSYSIGHDGSLTLLAGVAASTGRAPTDADLSVNSQYLYTLDSASHGISAFAIGQDGGLTPVPGVAGLPASAVGRPHASRLSLEAEGAARRRPPQVASAARAR